MSTKDTCCTIVPYFEVKDGCLGSFKELCQELVREAHKEKGCLYYGFSFKGNTVHCREGYKDAEALILHLKNGMSLINRALKISEIVRLEVHASEDEQRELKVFMEELNPEFFTLEYGFRR
jgi:quinol monooxygenase YgiN